jgi:hypothetical protein
MAELGEAGFAVRTLERARSELGLDAIRPSDLRSYLGDARFSDLGEEERRVWWLALPDLTELA